MRRIGIPALVAVLAACVPPPEPGFAPPPDLVLYSNGEWGALEFDNGTFTMGRGYCGTVGSDVAVVDELTGGTPSLQLATSTTVADIRVTTTASGSAAGTIDLTPYARCHLEFDAKLLAANATSVIVSAGNGSSCGGALPNAVDVLGQLSTTQFTRIRIPLTPDLFGAAGPQPAQRGDELLRIRVTLPAASSNRPVLLVNAVRWTGF